MIGKKINQLATELAPDSTDLTIIGDPISGVSKKITLAQLGAIFSGAVAFYTNLAAFPVTGDINVIYCAKDTQKLYLWSGSAYVEVFPSQALLNTYQLRSEKGVSNGYASLDAAGKVPISQLPSSIMEYKGTWNASTNTPTLANGTGDTGDVYICNVAGTVNFGAGPLTFAVGDYVIYSGTIWQRSSGAVGTVTSVAVSRSGDALAITGSPITTSGTINLGFAGNSTQYINGAGSLNTFPTLLSSVGLSMPSAFSVANSPLTANGTIAVTGAGNATQYVRGDGQLATLPTNGGGGGASVSYYLNGSVNQGTLGGVTYYEMNKTPIIGAGTDFSRSSNGYIASFLTDANDPALLNIPAGNFNFETYFQASSGGGSPTFYIELYKYDGSTFTLIASNSATPKLINDGVNIEAYFSALAVPQTTLTLTDRLAVRIYVTTAGRTITLHTENGHLCQVITTFTTGLTALNGLTSQVQYLATGTSGTDFNISSATATHTFNLPTASATNRGALSSTDWTTFNNKQNALTNPVTGTGASGQVTFFNGTSTVTGSNNHFWDATNNRLGIGTITPQRSIEIFNATADNHLRLSGNAPSVSMGEAVTGSIYQAKFGLVTINGQFVTAGVAGDFVIISQTGATIIGTSSTEKMRVQSSGNVSINNTNDTYKLDVTGTGRFTGQLRLESTITDGTYTYTLPSATGTLALTSALSFYLPLTGGTLTGALGGTSASFSSSVTAGGNIITTGSSYFVTSTSLAMQLNGSVANDFQLNGGGAFRVVNQAYNSVLLGIENTGAATFSSSVTAAGALFTSATETRGNIRTTFASDNSYYSLFSNDGALTLDTYGVGGYMNFKILGSTKLTLTNTGNVGIGTTSPTTYSLSGTHTEIFGGSTYSFLHVNTTTVKSFFAANESALLTALYTFSNHPLTFGTNNTERMRITSGGNVLINTTTDNGEKLQVNGVITTNRLRPSSNNTLSIVSNLTNYTIFNDAFTGLVIVRDNTTGGSGLYLLDPNLGVITYGGTLTYVLTFTYVGPNWVVQKSSGISTNISFNALAGV